MTSLQKIMNDIDKTPLHGANNTGRVLTPERTLELLKSSQHIAVEWARSCFAVFTTRFSDKLVEFSDRAETNQDRVRYSEFQRELGKKNHEFERYFCGYLGEGFIKFKNNKLDTHTGEEKYSNDMLSLVDNADLEETIAISSITQRVENLQADLMWALNQRFSMLNGGVKVYDRSNPVGPVQFCESLRKALKLFSFDTKVKIIAYKMFDQEFMVRMHEVLEESNQCLIDAGVLVNLRPMAEREKPVNTPPPMPDVEGFNNDFDTPVPEGVTPEMAAAVMAPASPAYGSLPPLQDGVVAAPDRNLPTEQYQSSLISAIHTLQGHIAQGMSGAAPAQNAGTVQTAAAPAAGYPPSALGAGRAVSGSVQTAPNTSVPYNSQQLVSALQNLQVQTGEISQQFQQAAQGEVAVLDIPALNAQLTQHLLNEAEDGAITHSDMHIIDLVGMLFEYMLSDDNLPDSVKALLSYLHTPFMKIAFIDKNFFEETEHPARLLLNNLAEAGVRWVSNDGTSQYDIYQKIKMIVSRVLEEFKNDVRIFAELLLDFSGYTKKISRRQELVERRAMEKVEGEEKLREVKVRVNTEVRSRTDGRELPSAVLLLLLQPWSDYLAFILLRYGDKSDTWARSVEAIDKILWTIEAKHDNAEKARQMEIHDDLLDVIETGFETIGYDQAKGKKLLDALISLQKLALQSKQVEAAPAPMRDKLEALASEKAGHIHEEDDVATPEETKMVENLKMIEFGTWFEFEGGKRLKVAWYNARTLHYMLVDQMGKKVAMKSGLQLARLMIAKEAKIIAGSSKPFFERALENIFESLNARVAEQEGGANAQ